MVTLFGFWCGVVGALVFPAPSSCGFLAASLVFDAVDGSLARAMVVRTRHVAWLAWSIDVGLAYWVAGKLPPPLAVACVTWLVLVQTESRRRDLRISGRVAVFCAAAAWALSRRWS
jgi:hypothetical protein